MTFDEWIAAHRADIYSWGKPSATGQFWNTCKRCQQGFPTQDPWAAECGCQDETDPIGVVFTPDREPERAKVCDCGAKVARTTCARWCSLNQ